jgi:cytochrome c oxidase cbb3-type subunit 3
MAGHNPFPDEGNTGHIWDEDIRELDNPPPLWWMIAQYLSFVLIIGYAIYYPTIPTPSGSTKGTDGWTQMREYQEDFQVLKDYRAKKFAAQEEALATLPVDQIVKDPELALYAEKTSKVLFGDYCAACHGSGGAGNPDYPVLADDDWLFGGSPATIQKTLIQGRKGNMPAYGHLGDEKIGQIADYLVALSQGKGNEGSVSAGKSLFMMSGCAGCHGPAGQPMKMMRDFMGAANLADGIRRFSAGDLKASYVRTIAGGVNQGTDPNKTRLAVMPSFKGRLSDTDIKRLTVYVHRLGGGE